jgi:hypothetical protein
MYLRDVHHTTNPQKKAPACAGAKNAYKVLISNVS